ncbi:hypothetical protein [Sphingobacterium sp.]|uniref:hypothetical protein n=1 Tax=Sphingobacterium sp. TaxID=341027 RepID=UPI00289ACBB6|nr:hypothetical protein [Sphingobacterium sp.]
MAETNFKAGDIVYHKANNLRMVVISNRDTYVKCRYINANGSFTLGDFVDIELINIPTNQIPLKTQLESKAGSNVK